jgi:HEAT repeat protein
LLCLGLCGCAGFWDDVTSRDFEVRSLFVKPNPLVVLRDSTDGDRRAQALRALKEPKQNGGTDEEQELVVRVLTTAVTNERQALCRLAAISTLGSFQDPRAAEALERAYYQAAEEYRSHRYPLETATAIQCQALTALGRTGNEKALPVLVRVVGDRQQVEDGSSKEVQLALDLRITAARSLGNFKQHQAAEALVRVLQTDKDVALRDCANSSLVQITGKELPPDPQSWSAALQAPEGKPSEVVPVKGTFDKILDWLGTGN